MIKINQPFP